MKIINQILTSYGIYPLKIEEITKNVFRIEDGRHIYALKKSRLTEHSIPIWESVLHQANAQNLNVLPVYLTTQRSLVVEIDHTYFYLSPWIDTTEQRIDRLYHCLGNIHAKTKQYHHVDQEKVEAQFHTYQSHREEMQKKLFNYVEQFEMRRYMAPFELLVCMQYRELEFAHVECLRQIDQFLREQSQQTIWPYSLCHGNLQLSHVLHANNTYLINWEKACYNNPIHDFIHLFSRDIGMYDAPEKSFIDQFSVYMDENELTKSELFLLTIYLLDPTEYIALIEDYEASTETMVKQVQRLQHAYRRLLFGLRWANYVEKTYNEIVLDDL